MAKRKPKPKPKEPKPAPPFDVSLAKRLAKGSTDPTAIIQAMAAMGLAVPLAAVLVDMDEEEFRELLAATDLGKAWAQAEALADATVCNKLLEACKAGNVSAQRFWLSARLPDLFGPRETLRRPPERSPASSESYAPGGLRGLKVIG